jgi:F-type H+-transporting ATPase subunit b
MEMDSLMRYWLFAVLITLFLPVGTVAEESAKSAEAADHDDHGAEGINLIDFSREHTPPLVALFLNFSLLVIIVYLIMRRPLSARFKERKEALETALVEARETKALAEKAIEEARAKMDAIDETLAALREEIVGAGKSESAKIVTEAEERSKRLLSDTEALVAHEVQRIASAIKEEAVEKIVARAEGIIRERISKDDHERITEEYLREINEDPVSEQGIGE